MSYTVFVSSTYLKRVVAACCRKGADSLGVHRDRGELPKRRAQLYAGCVDVLLGYYSTLDTALKTGRTAAEIVLAGVAAKELAAESLRAAVRGQHVAVALLASL
jgi:hypothetical protein